jgi:hypothetical protein
MKKYRFLKNRRGRILKVGDHLQYHGDICYIYNIDSDDNSVGIERHPDGISWLVEPTAFGGYWDENL